MGRVRFSGPVKSDGGFEIGSGIGTNTEVINSSGKVVYAGGSTGTVTVNGTGSSVDFDSADVFTCTISGTASNITITPSGGYVGQVTTIICSNSNTGGPVANSITWGSTFLSTGPLSVVSDGTYAVTFVKSGSNYYEISRTTAVS